MEVGYIYIHTNRINGKKYIGQTTKKPIYRWGRDGNGYKGRPLYSDIQKYGWEVFDHEVIEVCEPLLDFMERYFIQFYNTTNPEKGYNQTSGGNKGWEAIGEYKKKTSKSNKGRKLFFKGSIKHYYTPGMEPEGYIRVKNK